MPKSVQSNNQLGLYTKEKLIEKAKETAAAAPPEYQESTELYYQTRYFVSVYESRYEEIPLQVWNEYRNALDHYFRAIAARDSENLTAAEIAEDQIRSFRGHIQRALLDILKFMAVMTHDSIKGILDDYPPEVRRMVDGGKFVEKITKHADDAEALYLKAKVQDQSLGPDAQFNSQVLEMYMDAAFAFDAIRLEVIKQRDNLEHYSQLRSNIFNDGHNISIRKATFIAIVVGAAFLIIGRLIP